MDKEKFTGFRNLFMDKGTFLQELYQNCMELFLISGPQEQNFFHNIKFLIFLPSAQ